MHCNTKLSKSKRPRAIKLQHHSILNKKKELLRLRFNIKQPQTKHRSKIRRATQAQGWLHLIDHVTMFKAYHLRKLEPLNEKHPNEHTFISFFIFLCFSSHEWHTCKWDRWQTGLSETWNVAKWKHLMNPQDEGSATMQVLDYSKTASLTMDFN